MPQLSLTIDEINRLLNKYWHERTGLVLLLIISLSIEVPILFKLFPSPWIPLIIVAMTIIVIFLGWFISTTIPPKTPKGKVGFLLSLNCSDDKESEKIREDFIIPLRQLVKSGELGKYFHFIDLPQHLSKNIIDPDDAQSMRIKCRAHFMLYGRVRLRAINGNDHHFIDLEGIVAHRPVPKIASQILAKEFHELMPRKVGIPTENDLFTFNFTSEWADIVARYIIGTAAAFSGDLNYSEKLYRDALERLKGKNADFPIYSKISERLPIRLSELNETRAESIYNHWVKTHDPIYIDKMDDFLKLIIETRIDRPEILTLRAIHVFLKNRDVIKSIDLLKKSPQKNNGLWFYNIGFLHGYNGNLKAAIRNYRQALNFDLTPEGIFQIEDFICWVVEQEPEKYQLYFCLGFLNWHTKGDYEQAINYFKKFLESSTGSPYTQENDLAVKWISEIKSQSKKN